MTTENTNLNHNRFGQVLICLLQGVLYRESDATLWQPLLELQARVRDYCLLIGLELILDEAEGSPTCASAAPPATSLHCRAWFSGAS